MQQKNDFENQVLSGLEKCGINLKQIAQSRSCIGAAVSGGADSISLLYALSDLCLQYAIPLKIITVNHFIREDSETCGDASFVVEQCRLLKQQNFDVEVTLYELKKGEVASLAEEKGIGEEAAARELRYKAFEEFIVSNNLSCLCLAHNKNDQSETLIMRFLQGAGGTAAGGIPCVRGKYVRPLLWTERSQIEAYLNSKGIEWRTDSTNSNVQYVRNRIRHKLVPVLDEQFSGWETAVSNGAQKALDDADFIQSVAEEYFTRLAIVDSEKVEFKGREFYSLAKALQLRLLLLAANTLSADSMKSEIRIPYVFLRDICDCADNYIEENSEKKGGGEAVKSFADLQFVLKRDGVLVKKTPQLQNEIVFSAIIEKSGIYEFPWGQVFVPEIFKFPVLLRSYHTDDMIETSEGGMKKVSDVISSWHVKENLRRYIPVVQALNEPEQRILCILGSCQGYKDWIVQNEKM